MIQSRKTEWFDDDAFWQDLYPFMFPQQRFEDTPEQIEKALALANPGGTSALDLCCGPGRCSIALAKKGFKVTGVDRTKFLLDKAGTMARDAGTTIEWVRMDMRDFIRPDAFDFVLSMFTSFGYFDDKEEDLLVLSNILTSLRPGGVCLMDLMGKECLARIFQPTTSELLPDGTKLIQRHEIFDDWTRVRNEWIVIRNGRAKSYPFHHTVYSGQELKDRMLQAGFADVKLYGNLDGAEYGSNAQRQSAVALKE